MSWIFVGGSQRSGTTLLQRFLCRDRHAHPRLAEASYLRALVQAYRLGKDDFTHDTRSYFSDPEDLRHFHAGVIAMFLHRTRARLDGAQHLVLKEPHLTLFFPDLFELVPEARFVVVMRDPRDIVASMIDVGMRMQQQGQRHVWQQRDIGQLCEQIRSFYAPILTHPDPGFRHAVLVIRYEDLVRHPDDMRARLQPFTGMTLDGEVADEPAELRAARAAQPRYQPWVTAHDGRAITEASIGRHAQVLTAAEIRAIEQHCRDLFDLFQYPRSAP